MSNCASELCCVFLLTLIIINATSAHIVIPDGQTSDDVIISRKNELPTITVKGTHWEVGLQIGKHFASMIQEYVEIHSDLQADISFYNMEAGMKVYESIFNILNDRFPNYVREIKATAMGAGVDFHKLMLLHMDDVFLTNAQQACGKSVTQRHDKGGVGCSDINVNQGFSHRLMTHTDEGISSVVNHIYFVDITITPDEQEIKAEQKAEKLRGETERQTYVQSFLSLCYAGGLPGYAFNYNRSGIVTTVNIMTAAKLDPEKMPRAFILRHMLIAQSFGEVKKILKDVGGGISDGANVNIGLIGKGHKITNFFSKVLSNEVKANKGQKVGGLRSLWHQLKSWMIRMLNSFLARQFNPVKMFSIEIGPNSEEKESKMDIMEIKNGEYYVHTNRFLRLKITEPKDNMMVLSSIRREKRADELINKTKPKTITDIETVISDTGDQDFPLWSEDKKGQRIRTVCVVIVDLVNRVFNIHVVRPNEHPKPLLVIPLQ